MEKQWDLGVCNENAGFLFKHRCSNPTSLNCKKCNKPICGEHSRTAEAAVWCIECAKKRSQVDNTRDSNHHRDYDDDPYFYGHQNYNGYGAYYGYQHYYGNHYGDHMGSHSYSQAHDPNDFTEADAESLQEEGMDDFESDINES